MFMSKSVEHFGEKGKNILPKVKSLNRNVVVCKELSFQKSKKPFDMNLQK